MNWQIVEAECNCPHKIDSWACFVSNYDVNDLDAAKRMVNKKVHEHTDSSEHCSEKYVEKEIQYVENYD